MLVSCSFGVGGRHWDWDGDLWEEGEGEKRASGAPFFSPYICNRCKQMISKRTIFAD